MPAVTNGPAQQFLSRFSPKRWSRSFTKPSLVCFPGGRPSVSSRISFRCRYAHFLSVRLHFQRLQFLPKSSLSNIRLFHRERLHETIFAAYDVNKLVLLFSPRVPGKTHLRYPVALPSCYQQLCSSGYSAEIPVVVVCSHPVIYDAPPQRRTVLLNNIPLFFVSEKVRSSFQRWPSPKKMVTERAEVKYATVVNAWASQERPFE